MLSSRKRKFIEADRDLKGIFMEALLSCQKLILANREKRGKPNVPFGSFKVGRLGILSRGVLQTHPRPG